MRSVAKAVVRRWRQRRGPANAWLVSGSVLAMLSVWRATAMLLSDVSADVVEDAVDGFAGKLGHWLMLAVVMLGYSVHIMRRKQVVGHQTPLLRQTPHRGQRHRRIARRIPLRPRARSRVVYRRKNR
jgi:hypothetical protein